MDNQNRAASLRLALVLVSLAVVVPLAFNEVVLRSLTVTSEYVVEVFVDENIYQAVLVVNTRPDRTELHTEFEGNEINLNFCTGETDIAGFCNHEFSCGMFPFRNSFPVEIHFSTDQLGYYLDIRGDEVAGSITFAYLADG